MGNVLTGAEGTNWLIERFGQNGSRLPAWADAPRDPFLQELASACQKWPGVFDDLAKRVVTYANFWTDQWEDTIVGMRGIDRRGSFQGAFLWTCSKYPWPTVEGSADGESDRLFMSPVLQLNFAELKLEPLGKFPPILFQVWGVPSSPFPGSRQDTFDRIIPLAEIASKDPDWSYKPWSHEELGYICEGFPDDGAGKAPTELEWYDGKAVGAYIEPGDEWSFSLGQFVGEAVPDLPTDVELASKFKDEDLQALKTTCNNLVTLGTKAPQLEQGNAFFGGQMDGYYGSYTKYYEIEGRTIYASSNEFDEMRDGVGIRTFWNGTLGVLISFDETKIFSRIES